MRLLIFVLLTLSAWAEPWVLPQVGPVSSRVPLHWAGKQYLSAKRVLMWADGPAGSVVQMTRGKRVLWRVRATFATGKPNLRYEARTPALGFFRAWVWRRDGIKQVGEVTLGLRLNDGNLAWMSQPLASNSDRPGTPNLAVRDRLYEIYLGPQMAPNLVVRRVSDGKPEFIRDVPNPDGEPFDLMDRRVYKVDVLPDGVQLSLADKLRHWHIFLFSAYDGALKAQREGVAALGERFWKDGEIKP
ncbi:hypothetical protein JST97_29100 [bacterium]|nr:hypothetical protein [bacterium]